MSNMWIIEEGLSSGERIIVEGLQKATPGKAVNPQPMKLAVAKRRVQRRSTDMKSANSANLTTEFRKKWKIMALSIDMFPSSALRCQKIASNQMNTLTLNGGMKRPGTDELRRQFVN